jgi:hypothetical protein
VFFIKVDLMQLSVELTVLGTFGEVQLEEFVGELEGAISEGALRGRTVLYDRSRACLMTCRNELWLRRIQEMVLGAGAARVAELVTASDAQSPALAPQWQRFQKLAEARSWVIRRGDDTKLQPTNEVVTQLFSREPPARAPALRRAG